MAGQLNEGAANKETTARDGRVTIPRTVQRVMHSRDGRSEYRICVAYPGEEAPPAGFPVIYLLDANAVFGTMVETMRV
ncbi:alpha/beta hydrolase, partial [Paenibacillus sepulcri]|nr:alpha/beta hydrolase [Paenibacillus sepulcri]